ncbi:DDB1- and CUL4-associated factor 6-like isoform X2 [Nylanderia fulva]|uniref:DDB1- and CUL4-associated factor 6-like isoform X2 n=1 Tax=Nylanderia fulva TaxID=613905 RepID=UPI0010FB53ED|nr:DDB1- and CUL4-associated factor 6-like isoform X2 [Nylanderia fulva]
MRKTRANIFRDIYYQPYNDCTRLKFYSSSKASLQLIQRMKLLKELKVHNGCVNSICWNNSGELILSGSDDQHLVLTNAHKYEVLTAYKTSHRANIFSAKFLPNSGDHSIVSCSGDGIILYTDLMRTTETFHNQFSCHTGTAYEIATIPDEPHSFLSCGEDGTVRLFDLRVKDKCSTARCKENVLISCQRAVTALSVNPVLPYHIAIGCSDSAVRIFDRRTLNTSDTGWKDAKKVRSLNSFTVPEFEGSSYRITSLSYSPDGQDVLVSYSSDHLYLFSVKDQGSLQLRKDATIGKGKGKKHPLRSSQPVRRLRLRGDWSDTGPNARPEREGGRRNGTEVAQARPMLHTSLMQRMTDVLSRMLNDPATRAALSGGGGEDSLENVIEQQEGFRNIENNPESNAERSNESVELNVEQNNHLETTGNTSMHINRIESRNTKYTTNTEKHQGRERPQECNQSVLLNSSANVNDDISIETAESNQTRQSQVAFTESISSHDRIEHNNVYDQNRSENEDSCANISSKQGNMMEHLQDRLTTMRDNFLERHGSEPAVNLTYSDKSSTNATISLDVGDEMTRDGCHPGPSRSNNDRTLDAGPSNNCSYHHYNDVREEIEESTCIDSDDEDVQSDERLLHPIEAEMDESITNVHSSQGHETFDDVYLTEFCVKQKYMGHRNARTMIKEANFWGDDFVMSGSDCGHVFVWERDTAKLCMLLEADQHVVNCLQPHPYLPLLATSGIDYDVKLWAPISEEPDFDEKFAEDLKQRNAVMLEETKDTITVPAVFMIRMLACLNQIRRGRSRNRRRNSEVQSN